MRHGDPFSPKVGGHVLGPLDFSSASALFPLQLRFMKLLGTGAVDKIGHGRNLSAKIGDLLFKFYNLGLGCGVGVRQSH